MDFLKRAEQVRNLLNAQLKAVVDNLTFGGVSANEIVILTVRLPNLQQNALQIMVVDHYIRDLKDSPVKDKATALEYLMYAADHVATETKSQHIRLDNLRFQLFNEEYLPPVSMETLQAAHEALLANLEEAAQVKEQVKAAAESLNHVVVYVEGYDRDDPVRLIHNGKELGYASYDEDGSAGMENVHNMAKNLAKNLGVELQILNTATEGWEDEARALGLNPGDYA